MESLFIQLSDDVYTLMTGFVVQGNIYIYTHTENNLK